MKVWITCFVMLFGVAELLQWFRRFSLPLPVFIVGGAFLAIASNYNKLTHLPFHPDYEPLESEPLETEPLKSESLKSGSLDHKPLKPGSPPLQSCQSLEARSRSQTPTPTVSFTIRKPFQPKD